MSLRLVQTCSACPEQYAVYDESERVVGYLRLRHGHFTANYPSVMGEQVYSANTRGDGSFDHDEREQHLGLALEAIKIAHEANKR